jgi:CheY-like chemotaxis protein
MGHARGWDAHDPAPLVLVIDDDEAQRHVLSRMLRHEGYAVLAVTDGESGLRTIAEHRPDLVLLDLSLPRMDGYEAARFFSRAGCRAVVFFVARFFGSSAFFFVASTEALSAPVVM